MESTSVMLQSLVQRLSQLLWVVWLLPEVAVASESGEEARCRSKREGAAKCKTLERFYSARDLLEPEEFTPTIQRSPSGSTESQLLRFPNGSLVSEQEIYRIFRTVDDEGNGTVSRDKLASFITKLQKVECSEDQIDSLLQLAGVEHKGFVEFEEFVRLYHCLLESCQECDDIRPARKDNDSDEGRLRDAFNVFDKNKDGFISPEELHLVVKCLNLPKKITECSRMIMAVDRDGDGRVDFEEFKHMMLSTSSRFL